MTLPNGAQRRPRYPSISPSASSSRSCAADARRNLSAAEMAFLPPATATVASHAARLDAPALVSFAG